MCCWAYGPCGAREDDQGLWLCCLCWHEHECMNWFVCVFVRCAANFPFFYLHGTWGTQGSLAHGVSQRNASLLWLRRNMNETLNQDTEPHESCQQPRWRRGMGPSVAAYEWFTLSHSVVDTSHRSMKRLWRSVLIPHVTEPAILDLSKNPTWLIAIHLST